MITKHLDKYIPGNPTIVVQNMPGAGSISAANYFTSVAKPDGLTIGLSSSALYFDQLIGRKEINFDWSKFTWIGTPERTSEIGAENSQQALRAGDKRSNLFNFAF